jgi:hypothetical protein
LYHRLLKLDVVKHLESISIDEEELVSLDLGMT